MMFHSKHVILMKSGELKLEIMAGCDERAMAEYQKNYGALHFHSLSASDSQHIRKQQQHNPVPEHGQILVITRFDMGRQTRPFF